jgi:hypothetical protein
MKFLIWSIGKARFYGEGKSFVDSPESAKKFEMNEALQIFHSENSLTSSLLKVTLIPTML